MPEIKPRRINSPGLFATATALGICKIAVMQSPEQLDAVINDWTGNARGGNACISFEHVHELLHVHETVNMVYTMNARILSGTALEKALAAKLEESLRGVEWLRGWQVAHVGGESDAGFDLLATVPLPG